MNQTPIVINPQFDMAELPMITDLFKELKFISPVENKTATTPNKTFTSPCLDKEIFEISEEQHEDDSVLFEQTQNLASLDKTQEKPHFQKTLFGASIFCSGSSLKEIPVDEKETHLQSPFNAGSAKELA